MDEDHKQKRIAFRDITDRGWQLQLIRSTWLPVMQKAVLIAIDSRGGYRAISDQRPGVVGCTASHATLAHDIGAHEDSVGRALRALKKLGLIDAQKRGCSGGAIIEDKRICWSNLDDLWQRQQEEVAPKSHPELPDKKGEKGDKRIETDIHPDIETDIDSDIHPDAPPEEVDKRLNEETNYSLSPPEAPARDTRERTISFLTVQRRDGTLRPKILLGLRKMPPPVRYGEAWWKVIDAMDSRGITTPNELIERFIALQLSPKYVLHVLNESVKRDGALYYALCDLRFEGFERWRNKQVADIHEWGKLYNKTEAEIRAKLKEWGCPVDDPPRPSS